MSSLVRQPSNTPFWVVFPFLEATKLFRCTSKLQCIEKHCFILKVIQRDLASSKAYTLLTKQSMKCQTAADYKSLLADFFQVFGGKAFRQNETTDSQQLRVRVEVPYDDGETGSKEREQELRRLGLPTSTSTIFDLEMDLRKQTWRLRMPLNL